MNFATLPTNNKTFVTINEGIWNKLIMLNIKSFEKYNVAIQSNDFLGLY